MTAAKVGRFLSLGNEEYKPFLERKNFSLLRENDIIAGSSAKKAPTKVETVKKAIFINEDERNEANQNLLDHIQSLNPDFIKNSCLVLKTDSIDYNTRHAASVYLSRFFTIQSIKQKKQLDTFASNPSNKEIIADLIQTLFTIIHSDNSTLQRECIHIFSLLVYINIDGIFDNLYQLFSLFDCDEIEKSVRKTFMKEKNVTAEESHSDKISCKSMILGET